MVRKVSASMHVLRNGGYLGVLKSFAKNAPTIKMEDSAEIKGVLQGTFEKSVYDRKGHRLEFNPLTDELQPILSINGQVNKLGIYLPVSANPSYEGGSSIERISVEAYDRSWLVKTTTQKERVYFQRGMLYLDAIEKLLTASGIGLIMKVPCSEVFSEDREDWEIGTDNLTIVNELLGEINYKPLWFNANGTAVLEPIKMPTVQNIQHQLDSRNPSTYVHPGLNRTMDFYQTPNVFICVCNHPDKNRSLTAVARNTSEYSPLSIQRRGKEIVDFESVSNIASQEALQKYAERKLFESLLTGEQIEVTTSLLTGWGIGDVVSLHYNDIHALCVSHRWSMTLKAGGEMSHTLEKISYNMDDVSAEEVSGNGG